jgi:hypothetical protein
MRRLLPGQVTPERLAEETSDQLRSIEITSGGQKSGQKFPSGERTLAEANIRQYHALNAFRRSPIGRFSWLPEDLAHFSGASLGLEFASLAVRGRGWEVRQEQIEGSRLEAHDPE